MAGENARILVVDDDPDVLALSVAVLEEEGFDVVAAPDGGAALRALAGDDTIALLFTDVVMPGLDGFELARRAKEARPTLRIVYTSGYMNKAPGSVAAVEGPLVTKPWRPRELCERISRELSHPVS